MSKKLEDGLKSIKVRDYDESTMSDEDIKAVQDFVPPMLFRWIQYPDTEDFDLEIKFLVNVKEDGALYTPWTEIPAFMVELANQLTGVTEDEPTSFH